MKKKQVFLIFVLVLPLILLAGCDNLFGDPDVPSVHISTTPNGPAISKTDVINIRLYAVVKGFNNPVYRWEENNTTYGYLSHLDVSSGGTYRVIVTERDSLSRSVTSASVSVPKTGEDFRNELRSKQTIDVIEFGTLNNIGSQNGATNLVSGAMTSLVTEYKNLNWYVDQFLSYGDGYVDMPDAEFIQKFGELIGVFNKDVFKDGTGARPVAALATMGVDNADKPLCIEYVKAFVGMNLFVGQENSHEDYSTKFHIGGVDVTVADILEKIEELGGEVYQPTGEYPIEAIRDAAIALLSNDNNKPLAIDVFTQSGNFIQLIGLVNRVAKAGFQPGLTSQAESALMSATGLDYNYLRQYGILQPGAFKPQGIQAE